MTERYLLSVITRNSPGVLSRVSGLLRRKLFNIDSLTVGRVPGGNESRFTIVIEGDALQAQKAAKLIDRLIEVRSVAVMEGPKCLRREQRIDEFVTVVEKGGIQILDWVRSGVIAMEA